MPWAYLHSAVYVFLALNVMFNLSSYEGVAASLYFVLAVLHLWPHAE
jgi:hypothetical protein